MRRWGVLAWLAALAACAPFAERDYYVETVTGARIALTHETVPDGFNIDGSIREAFEQYTADIGDGVGFSATGLTGRALPEVLVAQSRISFHTSMMFVTFAEKGGTVSVGLSMDYEGDATPTFADFRRAAEVADGIRLCSETGSCARFDTAPLRKGDIVLVRLP